MTTNEPVAIGGLITAAITSTLAILLFFGVDPDLVAGLTLAATAWVGVVAAVVRSKVTPVEKAIIGRAIVPDDGADRGVIEGSVIWTIVGILLIVALLVWLF